MSTQSTHLDLQQIASSYAFNFFTMNSEGNQNGN
jgi:hypothetical protein